MPAMTAQKHPRGFTLLEMAIAMVVVALLLGGLLPTLSSRTEQQQLSAVRQGLEEIEQSLIGFAIANGRLPCPASGSNNGVESFTAGGNASNGGCSNNYDGFVPAATLGLVTANGYAVDPWNNRIRYAVTAWSNNAYTKTGGMRDAGMSSLAPNLLVCSTATGISASDCAAGTALTASPGVPAIIYSTGKNGSSGAAGLDEAANPNAASGDNNRTFVSHGPSAGSTANGAFDDIMIWLSPNILLNRMVEAGKLP